MQVSSDFSKGLIVSFVVSTHLERKKEQNSSIHYRKWLFCSDIFYFSNKSNISLSLSVTCLLLNWACHRDVHDEDDACPCPFHEKPLKIQRDLNNVHHHLLLLSLHLLIHHHLLHILHVLHHLHIPGVHNLHVLHPHSLIHVFNFLIGFDHLLPFKKAFQDVDLVHSFYSRGFFFYRFEYRCLFVCFIGIKYLFKK